MGFHRLTRSNCDQSNLFERRALRRWLRRMPRSGRRVGAYDLGYGGNVILCRCRSCGRWARVCDQHSRLTTGKTCGSAPSPFWEKDSRALRATKSRHYGKLERCSGNLHGGRKIFDRISCRAIRRGEFEWKMGSRLTSESRDSFTSLPDLPSPSTSLACITRRNRI